MIACVVVDIVPDQTGSPRTSSFHGYVTVTCTRSWASQSTLLGDELLSRPVTVMDIEAGSRNALEAAHRGRHGGRDGDRVGIGRPARDGALARAVARCVLERDVVAVDRRHLEQAEDEHEEHQGAERELDGGLTAFAPQPAHRAQPCTRMSSVTLIVPDDTEMPKRLSEYGAVTVARTFAPAVQVPIAEIVTAMPGTLAELSAAVRPCVCAFVERDGVAGRRRRARERSCASSAAGGFGEVDEVREDCADLPDGEQHEAQEAGRHGELRDRLAAFAAHEAASG